MVCNRLEQKLPEQGVARADAARGRGALRASPPARNHVEALQRYEVRAPALLNIGASNIANPYIGIYNRCICYR